MNEAAVSKLMKTLGPNNPDLVQMASAALGYATNKMIGEDGLAGATIAQWGYEVEFSFRKAGTDGCYGPCLYYCK